jgi:hypothetical protein
MHLLAKRDDIPSPVESSDGRSGFVHGGMLTLARGWSMFAGKRQRAAYNLSVLSLLRKMIFYLVEYTTNSLAFIMKITLFFELQTMVMKDEHCNSAFLLRREVGLPYVLYSILVS